MHQKQKSKFSISIPEGKKLHCSASSLTYCHTSGTVNALLSELHLRKHIFACMSHLLPHTLLHHENCPLSPLDFKQKNKYIFRLSCTWRPAQLSILVLQSISKWHQQTTQKMYFQRSISSVCFLSFLSLSVEHDWFDKIILNKSLWSFFSSHWFF